MKILTVIGTRPQFIKACMLSNKLATEREIEEIIVHTGQHYDKNMSDIFFTQLNMPKPHVNLHIGSSSHGKQTGQMLAALEEIMMQVNPNVVLVYGDTNSTLAGALASSKLHIPLAHVEAGLRSFNKKMPEEINRVVTDHLSHLLFCPSHTAALHLKKEGITDGVYVTGDIMYDAIVHFKHFAFTQSTILQALSLTKDNYYLSTIHRAENTNDKDRLTAILQALQQVDKEVILPLHPGTKRKINEFSLHEFISSAPIQVIEPLSYFDMVAVVAHASAVITDSGGLQKEAYMLQVPCITVRDETEWIETVQSGWNHIVGANKEKIVQTLSQLQRPTEYPSLFGDGHTAKHIIHILKKYMDEQ